MQNFRLKSGRIIPCKRPSLSPKQFRTINSAMSNPLLVSNNSSNMIPKSKRDALVSSKVGTRPQTSVHSRLRYSNLQNVGLSSGSQHSRFIFNEDMQSSLIHRSKH
jgi:hypothetical protein